MSELLFGLNKFERNKFERFLSMIPYGERDAIPMTKLASFMGVSERDVRRIVESARRDGNIVATCEGGYFIPETLEELKHYYHTALARIKTGSKELKAVRRVLEELGEEGTDDQQSLFPE